MSNLKMSQYAAPFLKGVGIGEPLGRGLQLEPSYSIPSTTSLATTARVGHSGRRQGGGVLAGCSDQQTRHRRCAAAVGKHRRRQSLLVEAQVIVEQPLQHRTQVGGGAQIAVLVEIGVPETRPVGDHPTTLEGAASKDR